MNALNWTVIEKNETGPRASEAFCSVGRNALNLSAGAVALIPSFEEYPYIELLQSDDGRNKYIGIRFQKQPTENTLTVRRKQIASKKINGITVTSAKMLARAFGSMIAAKKGTTRYPVARDLNYPNVLMIKLSQVEKKAAGQGKFNMAKLY